MKCCYCFHAFYFICFTFVQFMRLDLSNIGCTEVLSSILVVTVLMLRFVISISISISIKVGLFLSFKMNRPLNLFRWFPFFKIGVCCFFSCRFSSAAWRLLETRKTRLETGTKRLTSVWRHRHWFLRLWSHWSSQHSQLSRWVVCTSWLPLT